MAARWVGLDEGGELDEFRVSSFYLPVDAEVVAPEGAGADHDYAKWRHGDYFAGLAAGDSTASRQRA